MVRYELPNYVIEVQHAPDARRLVLLFPPMNVRPRRPGDSWGARFVISQGMSSLSITPRSDDWYRGADLHDWFSRPPFREIMDRYDHHTFYGISMGGYAACAFSIIRPGSTVIACSPQSTLAEHLVPWETRYRQGAAQDWSGPWADGAPAMSAANKAAIAFDPFEPADSRHVQRLLSPKTITVRAPFLGHHLASQLLPFGALKGLFQLAHMPDSQASDFARMMRARRNAPMYLARLGVHARTPLSTAIAAVTRARAAAPTHDGVAMAYASVLFRSGRYDEGFPIIDGIRRRYPTTNRLHIDAAYLTARFQVALNDNAAAIETLNRLLSERVHHRAKHLLRQLQQRATREMTDPMMREGCHQH